MAEEEVAGDWRRQQNEKLHNLFASPSIIRVIKSRRIRWEGHVARKGAEKFIQNFQWKTEGKSPVRRPRRRLKIILK
jgi:hypothetical protein